VEPERIELLKAMTAVVDDPPVYRALPLRNSEDARAFFAALPAESMETAFRQVWSRPYVGYLVTRDPAGELWFVAVEPVGTVPDVADCEIPAEATVADLLTRLRRDGAPVRCCVAGFDVTLRLVAIPVAAHHR
jgi:hypothetical protein